MSKLKFKKTKDYDSFKRMVGNREVSMAHARRLAEAIDAYDLSEVLPVLVNEKMEIIDGQHRVEALRLLKQPVYYVVAPGASLEDVQKLNTSTKSWRLRDYVKSYAETGKTSYGVLLTFMDVYSLSASLSATILANKANWSGEGIGRVVKNGRFEVSDIHFAEQVGDFITRIRPNVRTEVARDRNFAEALVVVMRVKEVDRDRLAKKLVDLGSTIMRQGSKENYLREFEVVYNHKIRGEHVRFY